MILIDSSCWIEFYRAQGSPTAKSAVTEAIEADEAAVCGLVLVEVLGYAASASGAAELAGDFEAYHCLETSREHYEHAAAISRALRSRGVTVPPTDLVIAATAIGHSAMLLHEDRHFERIAEASDLRQRYVA